MCSNCAGDYENPDLTAETEEEYLARLEQEETERLRQRVRSAMATLCTSTRSLLTERERR